MAMIIFACLGVVTTAAVGRPVEIGTLNAILIGAGVGLFEEFYVQGPRGNWMREMHPLRSIFIYVLVVIVLYLIALHVTHLVLGRLDDLPVVYRRLPLWNSVLCDILGRRHPDDKGCAFHWLAHAARPYHRHLSSPRRGAKSPAVSRYQRLDGACRTARGTVDAQPCPQVPFGRIAAHRQLWRRNISSTRATA